MSSTDETKRPTPPETLAKINALFKEAVAFVRKSKDAKLSNEAKLKFYALFKQASRGQSRKQLGEALT